MDDYSGPRIGDDHRTTPHRCSSAPALEPLALASRKAALYQLPKRKRLLTSDDRRRQLDGGQTGDPPEACRFDGSEPDISTADFETGSVPFTACNSPTTTRCASWHEAFTTRSVTAP